MGGVLNVLVVQEFEPRHWWLPLERSVRFEFLEAGFIESYHNPFRKQYRHTFRKLFSAMFETVAKEALLVFENDTTSKHINDHKKIAIGIKTVKEYRNFWFVLGKQSQF